MDGGESPVCCHERHVRPSFFTRVSLPLMHYGNNAIKGISPKPDGDFFVTTIHLFGHIFRSDYGFKGKRGIFYTSESVYRCLQVPLDTWTEWEAMKPCCGCDGENNLWVLNQTEVRAGDPATEF